jgi:hypothetical protein
LELLQELWVMTSSLDLRTQLRTVPHPRLLSKHGGG